MQWNEEHDSYEPTGERFGSLDAIALKYLV
jgi:hypothetical protein